MITAIVFFKLAAGIDKSGLIERYESTAKKWAENPDLIEKWYFHDPDSHEGGGVYIWKNLEAACFSTLSPSATAQGGEDIVLLGLRQGEKEPLRSQIPQPALHAVVRMGIGPIVPLPMKLDTLVLDMKALTLSCVYRVLVAERLGARVLEIRAGRAGA